MARDDRFRRAHRSFVCLAAGSGVIGAVTTVAALLWGAVLFGVAVGAVTLLIVWSGFGLWRDGW